MSSKTPVIPSANPNGRNMNGFFFAACSVATAPGAGVDALGAAREEYGVVVARRDPQSVQKASFSVIS